MNAGVNYISKSKVGEIVLEGSKNNPLDLESINQLISAFDQSRENNDSCVLFKATGPNFTVGADLKYIRKLIDTQQTNKFSEFSNAFQNLTIAILRHPGIIIAGLHGWVIGGGFEMLLSADLRYASIDTRIMLPELSIGTMFSNASTKLLAQIVGLGRAKEIMFLGEEITPELGYKIGLINKICANDELDNELNITAGKIVSTIDPKALSLAKELIHQNLDLPIEQVLENELKVLSKLSTHQGFIDKVNKFSRSDSNDC